MAHVALQHLIVNQNIDHSKSGALRIVVESISSLWHGF